MGPRLFRRGNNLDLSVVELAFLKRQWGHAFSGVETRPACGLCWRSCSFNGATPFQAWKQGCHDTDAGQDISFNGATPFQAWKQIADLEKECESLSFNGATPFQAWKLGAALAAVGAAYELQWGHAFSGVETRNQRARALRVAAASMGPRLFRRGNFAITQCVSPIWHCFNGATPFQAWKHRLRSA